MKVPLRYAVSVAALAATGVVRAQIATEPFNYSGTVLNGNGGSGFAGGWATAPGQQDVNLSNDNMSLSYPAGTLLSPSGARVREVNGTGGGLATRTLSTGFDAGTESSFYFSLLARKVGAGGSFFNVNLLDNSGVAFFSTGAGSSNSGVRIGRNGSTTGGDIGASEFFPNGALGLLDNETYLYLGRVLFHAGATPDQYFLSIYRAGVDSVPASEPTDLSGFGGVNQWMFGRTTDSTNLSGNTLSISLGSMSGATADTNVDEFRLGSTYEHVAAPEPAAKTLNFGADQNLNTLSISGGTTVNVGRDSSGADVLANVTVNNLNVTGLGAHVLNTTLAANTTTANTQFVIDAGATLRKQGPGSLVINGAQSHGVGATLTAEGGTTTLNTDASGNLTVNANANVQFGSTQHLEALDVGGGATASVLASGNKVLASKSVSVNGAGKLDLNDNDAVINYTGGNPLASIQASIASGYNGGAWTGNGITSTSAAGASGSGHPTALGYADNALLGLSNFRGETVGASSILIGYVFSGDANLDERVNALDFSALASNFGNNSSTWLKGDFNYDGSTNTLDFNLLAMNFNQVLAGPALGAAVPEPMILAIPLGCIVLALRQPRGLLATRAQGVLPNHVAIKSRAQLRSSFEGFEIDMI